MPALPRIRPNKVLAEPGPVRSNSRKSSLNIRSVASPLPSRAATPLYRIKSAFTASDIFESDGVRSRSRAKPGRPLPEINIPSTAGKIQCVRERTPTPARRLRFESSSTEEKTIQDSAVRSGSISPVPYIAEKEEYVTGPRDERGLEMSDNARVWRIYINEATKTDTLATDGWNRSLDVLLVFTGLFSAVLTTFIIQSYQMIIPNPGDTTNALLSQMIALQANSSASNTFSTYANNLQSPPGQQALWVNGLWFAALACSLSSALVSMLAKQWLQAYVPNISGTPHYRARLRQSRMMQVEAWHVSAIINSLPLLLHVALLLFFAGLVVLLWSTDIAITVVTLAIVSLAYLFYSASIWLPLIYPDCPYHHPLSAPLQAWSSRQSALWTNLKSSNWKSRIEARLANEGDDVQPEDLEALDGVRDPVPPPIEDMAHDDHLDARALCWLWSSSTDPDVVAVALQAIAGLPRNFTALQIFREADALHLVEQGFQSCFHKDTTVDLRWHLRDIEGAELYCRAWMRLAWGTSEQWPIELVEPLWILQDLHTQSDVAAIASCAIALSSLNSLPSQWELLAYLARSISGELQLAHVTQCWLLDSIGESVTKWEMPKAVIEETTARAVPIFLNLLNLTQDLSTSSVHSAAALALHLFVCGPLDLWELRSEEIRKARYCELTLKALATIALSPENFDVQDTILDLVALELSHLAGPLAAQSERFASGLKEAVSASLLKLFIDGRLSIKTIPYSLLVDVLQLLSPPANTLDPSQRSGFVTMLLETLETAHHPDVTTGAVRILELQLLHSPMHVCDAFAENDGIGITLRAAKAGNVDSRGLQMRSLRTLCAFINSSAKLFLKLPANDEANIRLNSYFDKIFCSDFFEILCSVVSSRGWWLSEVGGYWMPALVRLCRIRPEESVWVTVVRSLYAFADHNLMEESYGATLSQLEFMRHAIGMADSPIVDEYELDVSWGTPLVESI